ncbi:MAG: hypothetical protein ACRDPR_19010 [Nocardioidaceae bacterium]
MGLREDGGIAARRLRLLAIWILALNVVATVVAIVVNLPSQFGIVGTDASQEFLISGTAISAPLLPVVLLAVVAVLADRRDPRGGVGIVAAYLTAVTVAIGGVGEMVATPTADTSKGVLVGAGVAWLVVAAALVAQATLAATERRSRATAGSPLS